MVVVVTGTLDFLDFPLGAAQAEIPKASATKLMKKLIRIAAFYLLALLPINVIIAQSATNYPFNNCISSIVKIFEVLSSIEKGGTALSTIKEQVKL